MDGITKQCSYCEKVKPLSGFYRNASMSKGVGNRCRLCTSQSNMKARSAMRDLSVVKEQIAAIHETLMRLAALIEKGNT